jgi:hypothetical protein
VLFESCSEQPSSSGPAVVSHGRPWHGGGEPTRGATEAVADQAGGARGQMHQRGQIAVATCRRDQRLLLLLGRRELDDGRCAAGRQAVGAHGAGRRAGP